MSWQALVILNALLMGTSMIVMRILARDPRNRGTSFAVNACQYVLLWLSGLLLVPRLGHVDSHIAMQYFWRFLAGGILFAITNVATYKSLVYVDAAVGSIFNTLNALFTVGVAAVMLHQNLTPQQLAGAVILTVAIAYSMLAVRAKTTHTTKAALETALFYALIGGISYAFAISNEQWLLQRMSAASYVVYGWGWQTIMAVSVALLIQPKKITTILRAHSRYWLVVLGLLRGSAGVCFVLAQMRSSNVALITVIANFKLVVVMLFGIFWLREHRHLVQKAAGTLASLTGLSIMFWK